MSEITDLDVLRRAMAENSEQPEGPARNARAEELLTAAEKLNIPLAVIEALGHQLKVYNYSSEKGKMFVPFARLLRMWDERPEDFDEYETHSLHWVFKWVSSGMLDQPHIPLASIEKWLGEMAHRYRLAGHSERAVRSAEHSVAAHVGDLARAERAYAAWLAADRDGMADCHACELHGQGWWQAERGRDVEALELWRPVLEGEYACAHEPHSALASSLVPLLRLGRLDEARANHLRGFRLVRAMESMRGAYAEHVEFCALTGNEARGLELLAGRPAYFTDEGQPQSKLEFMSVVALLMDRLTALGLGDREVPGPAGRVWTARELAAHARAEALTLAARFDERNGTTYVSERARARMERRPLVERLPLGVRSVRPVPPPAPPVVTAAATGQPDLPALLAEARRLSDHLRPGAVEAWAAVAEAAEGGEGGELAPRDRAEIADHEAMGLGPEGTALFERAAELYAAAGDPGEALAARARAAYVRALAGDVDAALAAVSGPYDEILALYATGDTGIRQTASVLMARARILLRRAHKAGADAAREGDAEGHGPEPIPARAEGQGPDAVLGEGAEAAGDEAAGSGLETALADDTGPRPETRLGQDTAPSPETDLGQDTAPSPETDLGQDTAPSPETDLGQDTAPSPETDLGQDTAPSPEADLGQDTGGPETVPGDGAGSGPGSVLAMAETAVREVVALVEGRAGQDVRLAARGAEARAMLAELAGLRGDLETAATLFARGAAAFVAAGLPWYAVEYEARLASLAHHLGDMAEAERALRAALEHGGAHLEAPGRAQLHLQLAELTGARGEVVEAAQHALEAAHWADEAGEGATLGAWARQQLGGFLLRQGRWAEAAEVLESALPDLTAETHGDGAVVQTQWWLGDCLSELGEHRAAAERRLQAAEIARHWPEQHDHATLAHLAGESLGQAGLADEADRAYARAGDLWRELGNAHGLIRALRARAWLALRTEDGLDQARALMADAVRECEAARDAAADAESRQQIVSELGHTHRQFGDLLARSVSEGDAEGSLPAVFEEALSQLLRSAEVFATLGDGALHSRTGAELTAGWLEIELGRLTDARARARAVLAAYDRPDGAEAGDRDGDGEALRARRAEAEHMLRLAAEDQD
ncbi:tetratricopeptide repeat protein [Streptomyces afghaniensis]|uniref:tetratricopeptide repeat protein n=1 Tax=Streptomyces afghaniensis TaxID=66865 RepID=UPI002789ECE3|nr:tetratricopeptide repeat protein [Streptomyces afghaniensis]MDQ1016005.1 tetratricopeptide (TPR) repeat protein [Streptomyces afghaniensis]